MSQTSYIHANLFIMENNLTLKLTTTVEHPELYNSVSDTDLSAMVVGYFTILFSLIAVVLLVKMSKEISMATKNYMWSEMYNCWRCRYGLQPDL